MGITDRKTIELGLGFLKFGKTIGWEMGFGQKFGLGKWDLYPPFRTLLSPCVVPPASELAGYSEPALTFAENELGFLEFM